MGINTTYQGFPRRQTTAEAHNETTLGDRRSPSSMVSLDEGFTKLENEQYGPWMSAPNPRTPFRRPGEQTAAGGIPSHGGGTRHLNGERGWARRGGDIFSAPSMMHSGNRVLGDADPRDTITAEKWGHARSGEQRDSTKATSTYPRHGPQRYPLTPPLTATTHNNIQPAQPPKSPTPPLNFGSPSPQSESTQSDTHIPQPKPNPQIHPNRPHPLPEPQPTLEPIFTFAAKSSPKITTPPPPTNPDLPATATSASRAPSPPWDACLVKGTPPQHNNHPQSQSLIASPSTPLTAGAVSDQGAAHHTPQWPTPAYTQPQSPPTPR
ncbi:hypothetical protein Salat_1093300 [Sesamum alatum]|uniref:Uncharacterized protein n=1 Tax=Sesamum alatum TaxID=300844 RepID=A0AAE2CSW8_9LAMI|nr:hypothetical protein Salat_1093300 [Sesamum alatum]